MENGGREGGRRGRRGRRIGEGKEEEGEEGGKRERGREGEKERRLGDGGMERMYPCTFHKHTITIEWHIT